MPRVGAWKVAQYAQDSLARVGLRDLEHRVFAARSRGAPVHETRARGHANAATGSRPPPAVASARATIDARAQPGRPVRMRMPLPRTASGNADSHLGNAITAEESNAVSIGAPARRAVRRVTDHRDYASSPTRPRTRAESRRRAGLTCATRYGRSVIRTPRDDAEPDASARAAARRCARRWPGIGARITRERSRSSRNDLGGIPARR